MSTKKKNTPAAAKPAAATAAKKDARRGPRPARTPEQIAARAASRSTNVQEALRIVLDLAAPARDVLNRKGEVKRHRRAGQLYGFDWDAMGAQDVKVALDDFLQTAGRALTRLLPVRGRRLPEAGSTVQIKTDVLKHYPGIDPDATGRVLAVYKPEKGGYIARVEFSTGDIERIPTARLVEVVRTIQAAAPTAATPSNGQASGAHATVEAEY